MKELTIATATFLAVALIVMPAKADVPLNWESNRSDSNCVVEVIRSDNAFQGSLRLSTCTSGFGEGTITLPTSGRWTIAFQVGTDEDPNRDASDSMEVVINGTSRATFLNTPANVNHLVTTTVEGSSFTYRFNFESGNPDVGLHMLVLAGVAVGPTIICDADGNGTVTVSDGVNALRAAAGLQSACNP